MLQKILREFELARLAAVQLAEAPVSSQNLTDTTSEQSLETPKQQRKLLHQPRYLQSDVLALDVEFTALPSVFAPLH